VVDPRSRPEFARRAWQFLRFTFVKAWRDALPLEASALAYTTLLSLVPLLAAFLFVGERVFREYPLQILSVLSHVLPYSEAAILGAIREFLEQAQLIRGPALAGFLAVALFAVAHVEKTFNRIWQVPTGPIWGRWGRRVLTRVSIFIVVPLAVGALFSLLLLLRRQGRLQESWWGEVLPIAATTLALTILYWVVPNTRVRLSAALAGALPTAAAFDLLRRFFRLYLEAFPAMSLVYGGFALAILFMMSIQVSWLMVLLGAEVAYAAQHFPQIETAAALIAELPTEAEPQPKPETES
jgi:membrane protein